MAIDMELVKAGMKEPRDGLVQQGNYTVELGRKEEAELAAHGWSKEETDQLEKDVSLLSTSVEDQSAQKISARDSTSTEVVARAEAKELIRKIRYAFPMALRAKTDAKATADSILSGEKLGRSTPKILAYLTKVRPVVVELQEQLKKYFKNQSPVELLDARRTALSDADSSQEVELKNLPSNTLMVYENKGRVLRSIDDLNRVGRIAFDGQAEKIALFNKDILYRARKKKPTKTDADKKPGING